MAKTEEEWHRDVAQQMAEAKARRNEETAQKQLEAFGFVHQDTTSNNEPNQVTYVR